MCKRCLIGFRARVFLLSSSVNRATSAAKSRRKSVRFTCPPFDLFGFKESIRTAAFFLPTDHVGVIFRATTSSGDGFALPPLKKGLSGARPLCLGRNLAITYRILPKGPICFPMRPSQHQRLGGVGPKRPRGSSKSSPALTLRTFRWFYQMS